jgi:hypothetical protein
VRRQHPAAAAEARWQDQVGQPDQPGIVLDEGGLGLFETDARVGGGGCVTLGYIL